MSIEPDWEQAITKAIMTKNQPGLTTLLVSAVFSGKAQEVEAIALRVMAEAPHEIHSWWMGPCNCDGRLN